MKYEKKEGRKEGNKRTKKRKKEFFFVNSTCVPIREGNVCTCRPASNY